MDPEVNPREPMTLANQATAVNSNTGDIIRNDTKNITTTIRQRVIHSKNLGTLTFDMKFKISVPFRNVLVTMEDFPRERNIFQYGEVRSSEHCFVVKRS